MTDYATADEARAAVLAELKSLYGTVTTWDTAILDQVVLHLDDIGQPIGMNLIRQLVPEDACKRAGLYFHALTGHDALHPDVPPYLRWVGDEVSLNTKARGKKVNVYRLTQTGRRFIEARVAARTEQRRAAA